MARYDEIGTGYARARRADPRIQAQVHAAMRNARTVVNIGAGTGSYEPKDRAVVAVEPSEVMVRQRAADAAPCLLGMAEALPFADQCFDVAMATVTLHHWIDTVAGLREMQRVAAGQVILLCEPTRRSWMWLTDDYFPDMYGLDTENAGASADACEAILRVSAVEVVPIPGDCLDGFGGAYWNRPEMYLDPEVRAGISMFRLISSAAVEDGTTGLRRELASGEWDRKYGHLRSLAERDLGYRLVIAGRSYS